MRFFAANNDEPLSRSRKRDVRLGGWLSLKLEDGISKRFWLDQEYRENIRAYECIPTIKSTEIPQDTGQSEIEIPVGAAMVDGIASSIYDLIFNTSPVFAVRGSPGYEAHAYAFQLLSAKLIEDEFVNFLPATNEFIVDTVMLGTGSYYVVSTRELLRKASFQELRLGPRVYCAPPEDIVVPGGCFADANDMQFIGYRNYFYEMELNEAAAANEWNVKKFKHCGNVDWVRQRRVDASRVSNDLEITGGIYEVFYVHCQYDYDEDGFAEDLFVVWDRISKEIGLVTYAPYDSSPFVFARYQLRPHIFPGIGVMTMAKPFEREVTEWHNFKMKNAHLANSRVWAYKLGAVGIGEELKISPNKAIGLGDPANDLIEKKMSEMYPSAQQYESATIALAEMRIGTPAVGPAQRTGVAAGKRVPAATAATLMQQQNRRFAAPFDNVRRACAGAITQCFMRMREQYEKGDTTETPWRSRLMEYLVYTVGMKNASLIEEVFKKTQTVDMRDKVLIETTATAQTINRQMDRQNAIERIQVMGQYYDKSLQLGQLILNPQTPPPLKQLAIDVANGTTESIRAFLRSFDDCREPDVFIPNIFKQIESISKGGGDEQQQQPQATGTPNQENLDGQQGASPPSTEPSSGENGPVTEPLQGSSELGRGADDTGING